MGVLAKIRWKRYFFCQCFSHVVVRQHMLELGPNQHWLYAWDHRKTEVFGDWLFLMAWWYHWRLGFCIWGGEDINVRRRKLGKRKFIYLIFFKCYCTLSSLVRWRSMLCWKTEIVVHLTLIKPGFWPLPPANFESTAGRNLKFGILTRERLMNRYRYKLNRYKLRCWYWLWETNIRDLNLLGNTFTRVTSPNDSFYFALLLSCVFWWNL